MEWIQRIANALGVLLPAARAIRFGAGLRVTHVPEGVLRGSVGGKGEVTGYYLIEPDGSAVLGLYGSNPAPVGAAAVVGVSALAAPGDHGHAHGSQAGGSLHALGSDVAAGFVDAGERSTLSTLASLPRPLPGTATTGGALPITGASAAGDSSGRVALGITSHPFATGDRVFVHGVGGVTGAEGAFVVTDDDVDTVFLNGSTFGGAYTSGGVVYRCADLVAIPAPDDASTVAIVSVTAKSATGSYRRTLYLGIEVSGGVATPALTTLATTHDGLALDSVAVVSIADSTGEIEITTHRPHGASTGDTLLVSGVGSGADGAWTVTRVSSTKAKLNGSTYSAPGTTGSALLGWRSAIAGEWAADVFTVYAIGSGDAESVTWSAQAFGVV